MSQKFSAKEDEQLIDMIRHYPPLYQVKSRSYKNAVVKNNIWNKIAHNMGKTSGDCKQRWKSIRDYYQRKKRDYLKGTSTGSARDDDENNFYNKFKNLQFLENTSMTERQTISSSSCSNARNDINEALQPDTESDTETQNFQDTQSSDNSGPDTENTQHIELEFIDEAEEIVQEEPAEEITEVRNEEPRPKRSKTSKESAVLEEIKKGRAERTTLLRELVKSSVGREAEDEEISLFFRSIACSVAKLTPLQKAQIKVDILNIVSNYEIQNITVENHL